MKNYVVRCVVAFLAIVLFSPQWVAAQTGNGSANGQQQAVPNFEVNPDDQGVFVWRNLGVDPVVPKDLLPADYGKSSVQDAITISKMGIGAEGWEEQHKLFWYAVACAVDQCGKPVDPEFRSNLIKILSEPYRLTEQHFAEGSQFNYPMASGHRLFKGNVRMITAYPPPRVAVPGGIDAYVLPGVRMPSGRNRGKIISLVVPKACINVTAIESTEEVPEEIAPVERNVAQVRVLNQWLKVDGKKAKTPSRQDVQARVEAVPMDGGRTVTAEFYNNEQVVLELEPGKQFTITEILNSPNWRFEGASSLIVTVAATGNPDVVFRKIEVLPFGGVAAAAPPPIPEKTTVIEKEKKGSHWKLWTGIGIATGVAIWALTRGGKEKETVILDQQKGQTSPGGSPASTAGFGFSFSFGGGS